MHGDVNKQVFRLLHRRSAFGSSRIPLQRIRSFVSPIDLSFQRFFFISFFFIYQVLRYKPHSVKPHTKHINPGRV